MPLKTNDPSEELEDYENLTPTQKATPQRWIANNLASIASFNTHCTIYGLKHFFEASPDGFYIHNGVFKGAMLAAGYNVKERSALNWSFNVSQKSVTQLYKWINDRDETMYKYNR